MQVLQTPNACRSLLPAPRDLLGVTLCLWGEWGSVDHGRQRGNNLAKATRVNEKAIVSWSDYLSSTGVF